MSLSLLLQQFLACLVHFTWMVLEKGDKWPYSCCFVGCYFHYFFNIACSVLVQFLSSIFFTHFINVHLVHLYRKKSHFILLERSDFHMIESLIVVVHSFTRCILTSLSVDETLLLRYVNLPTNFRRRPFTMACTPFCTCVHAEANALCFLHQAMQQGFSLGMCICKKS